MGNGCGGLGSQKNEEVNIDLFLYTNSKFIYLEKHMRTQMKQLYTEVLFQQYKIEQVAMKNFLAIATQSPDQFAYTLKTRPGYLAMPAGEVINIVQCVPVVVKLERSEECYAKLKLQ